jgi:hypothetical protein
MAAPDNPAMMNRSLRTVLGESHVAMAAVALLVLWCAENVLTGLAECLRQLWIWGLWIVSVGGFPSFSRAEMALQESRFVGWAGLLLEGLFEFVFAWLVSRWVYGTGPLQILRRLGNSLMEKRNA